MKRSYEDMISTLSEIPSSILQEPKTIKTTLNDSFKFVVFKAVDISKATVKPIDDIEEPEEEQDAIQKRLDRNNARMMQLTLKDRNGAEIRALETERIDLLSNLAPDWTIEILGPADVRCGNIMLEKRHVIAVEPPVKDEHHIVKSSATQSVQIIDATEDWDEADEEDCIIID